MTHTDAPRLEESIEYFEVRELLSPSFLKLRSQERAQRLAGTDDQSAQRAQRGFTAFKNRLTTRLERTVNDAQHILQRLFLLLNSAALSGGARADQCLSANGTSFQFAPKKG